MSDATQTEQVEQVRQYAELQAELRTYDAKVARRDELAENLSKSFKIKPDALETFVTALVAIEPQSSATPRKSASSNGSTRKHRTQDDIERDRKAIVKMLDKMGGKATIPQMSENAEVRQGDITALVKSGEIVKTTETEKSARGKDSPYYALPTA